MAKVRVIIELEVDEQEVKDMVSSQNDYQPLTVQEYFEGMKFEKDGWKLVFDNKIEEYYNVNEGDSNCIKGAKLISMDMIEE